MYTVQPYFDLHDQVKPASIVYSLPSYHADTPGIARTSSEKVLLDNEQTTLTRNLDPVQTLEQKQLALIDELNEFINRINSALTTDPSRKRKSPDTARPNATATKNIAVKQPLSKTPKSTFSYHSEFSESVITGQSLRPCLPPTLAEFQISTLPKIVSLHSPESDRDWLANLSAIAANRSVVFKGHLTNKCCAKQPKCTVQIELSDNGSTIPSATIDGGIVSISGRITIWKLLGALLGLYTFDSTHASLSTHVDKWLLMAQQYVMGRIDHEGLCRAMNPVLSRSDYLASASFATIADVILKSVSDKNGAHYANNVEMWLARMGQAMALC